MRDYLEQLDRNQLIGLLEIMSKNIVAMDGVWFQAIEREQGMDAAMHFDMEAWKHYPGSECRRLKEFLKLGEHPGLDGLEQVLRLRYSTLANEEVEIYREDNAGKDSLVYRIVTCRIQKARERKGLELHPCKFAAVYEFEATAKSIDTNIECECLSCFPDQTEPGCGCAWRFALA